MCINTDTHTHTQVDRVWWFHNPSFIVSERKWAKIHTGAKIQGVPQTFSNGTNRKVCIGSVEQFLYISPSDVLLTRRLTKIQF